MKIRGLLFSLIIAITTTSCIKDEPLNSECDITAVSLANDNLKGEPILENDKVTFLAKPSIDLTALAPTFLLTEGAVITPASGTVRDFSSPQTYTVTSQDKKWSKEYTVRFNLAELRTRYSFEHFEQKGKYYLFYEQGETEEDKQYIWASGNGGFSFSGQGSEPGKFPTTVEPDGLIGNGVRMVTRSTGSFGVGVKMPIAAGNLFIGTFNSANAITNPLGATKFGLPFAQKPVRLRGWYKYTPGAVFTDKFMNVLDKTDQPDIYAVIYEPVDDKFYLTGDNVLTHESIIAIARLKDRSPKEKFTMFNLLFEYLPGKELETEKLENFKYNMSIVFSSSIDGAFFEGAVGSTLIVDEVELVCEEK
ncbi:MAG: PCMD domain-containing protein [Bacteroidales bacterium]